MTVKQNKVQRRSGLLGRLSRCRSGMAAVEFGYIVPIMFFMFAGSLEFSQAITVDRRVTQVASSTADLVARQKAVTSTLLDGYMQIISHLMRPYDDSKLFMTIVNAYGEVDNDGNNIAETTKVCWSYNRTYNSANKGVNTYTAGQAYPLPAGLVDEGTSVIAVEVRYDYDPLLFSYFITSTKQMTETFYLKPRLSASVQFNGGTPCV